MLSTKTVLSAAALIAGTAFITAQVMSGPETTRQTTKSIEKAAQPAMQGSPGMEEMMQKWEAFSTPGPQHAAMKANEGKWNMKITHWMAEGAPPQTSTATANARMAMGGRYLIEDVKGEGMDFGDGQKHNFEGMAVMGFNNATKEFFSFWIDNMGTGHMLENGTGDASKRIETSGEMFCPMRGKDCQTRSVSTMIDANTRKLEMWAPDMVTNKMFKTMEIMYTRAK